jgi:hypothetical protein
VHVKTSAQARLVEAADGDRNAELSNANKSFADRRVTGDPPCSSPRRIHHVQVQENFEKHPRGAALYSVRVRVKTSAQARLVEAAQVREVPSERWRARARVLACAAPYAIARCLGRDCSLFTALARPSTGRGMRSAVRNRSLFRALARPSAGLGFLTGPGPRVL